MEHRTNIQKKRCETCPRGAAEARGALQAILRAIAPWAMDWIGRRWGKSRQLIFSMDIIGNIQSIHGEYPINRLPKQGTKPEF